MTLSEIRGQLDELDTQIAALYCRRLRLIREVVRAKEASGAPIRDAKREHAVVERLCAACEPEYHVAIERLYEHIFSESRAIQETEFARLARREHGTAPEKHDAVKEGPEL